jgi:hypothetical protein
LRAADANRIVWCLDASRDAQRLFVANVLLQLAIPRAVVYVPTKGVPKGLDEFVAHFHLSVLCAPIGVESALEAFC